MRKENLRNYIEKNYLYVLRFIGINEYIQHTQSKYVTKLYLNVLLFFSSILICIETSVTCN